MKKNRILIRTKTMKVGGIEKVLSTILSNIELKDKEIHLVIQDNHGENNAYLENLRDEIKIKFIWGSKFVNLKNNSSTKLKLLYKIIEKFYAAAYSFFYSRSGDPFDIFIDYDSGTLFYSKLIKAKKRIVFQHSSPEKLYKTKSKLSLVGKCLENYNLVVAVCDEMKKELESLYPKLKNKIIRKYNPFDFGEIRRKGDDSSTLSEEELELLKRDYCVAVSRLDLDSKDYETLLKAFKILQKDGREEQLYIVGDGPDRDKIELMIENFGLIKNVKMLGMKENPYVWIKNSKALILSSKYEGFGLVLVEAMMLGVPVISSDCSVGPKEILENGKSGLLFKVGDEKELSKKIRDILDNKSSREYLIKNSLERLKAFDILLLQKEYSELLIAPKTTYER